MARILYGEGVTVPTARAVIAGYRTDYNERRPHSALHYLRPRDYYRGAPATCLAEREAKLQPAAEARRAYWEHHRDTEARSLS